MRYAIFSDIHANLPALNAALDAIHADGADRLICLGDLVNSGPFPAACVDRVRALGCPVVQGNHEQYVLQQAAGTLPESPAGLVAAWTASQLSADQLAYLAALPACLQLDSAHGHDALCVHASPASDQQGFLPGQDDETIATLMAGRDGVTVFAGHTHQPLYRRWSRSWLINGGSIGMPLDGTTTAKYCLAEDTPAGWQIQFRAVSYDVDEVIRAFDTTGLQAAGGVFAALFRFQMATGQVIIGDYFAAVDRFASLQSLTMDAAMERFPVPAVLRRWWPPQNGSVQDGQR